MGGCYCDVAFALPFGVVGLGMKSWSAVACRLRVAGVQLWKYL